MQSASPVVAAQTMVAATDRRRLLAAGLATPHSAG